MYLQLCSTTTMLSLPKNISKCFVSCECPSYCPPARLYIWKLLFHSSALDFPIQLIIKRRYLRPNYGHCLSRHRKVILLTFSHPGVCFFTALLGVECYYNRIKVIMAKNMVIVCFRQNTPVGWVKSHTSQPMTLKRSCYRELEGQNVRNFPYPVRICWSWQPNLVPFYYQPKAES